MPIGLAPTVQSKFEYAKLDEDALNGAPEFDLPFNPGVKIRGTV